MNKGKIQLNKINKVYENGIQAVFDFNLDVKPKEFIALVGPSGCGKSTTLRMIAGLEEISYGELNFDGTVMNAVSSKDRNIAMVFQNYALYPHMNIFQNMGFSLKMRKVSKEEISKKVTWAAEILGLTNYLNRKPKDLSGGQRQRVALGRAIVRDPRLFLMDEPLSNLDAKLRTEMRNQIKQLHKKLGATTIYVTHDQVEAMTMADRIVVMKDGFVQQIGTPTELFETPSNLFVAKFIGAPEVNLINGKISKTGVFTSLSGDIKIQLSKKITPSKHDFNKEVILGIRPFDVSSEDPIKLTHKDTKVKVHIDSMENLGTELIVYGTTKSGDKITHISRGRYHEVSLEKDFDVYFNKTKIMIFDVETGVNISAKLNEPTQNALKVIENRSYDYEVKNELLKTQASKKTVKEKMAHGIKNSFSKMKKTSKSKNDLKSKGGKK